MSTDVVARAREALEGVTKGPWKLGNRAYPDVVHTPHGCLWNPSRGEINNPQDGEFIAAARSLVPELVAEVERLRAGGAWTEHVESQKAMKTERDGDCICNTGPDTEGPDEFCPWHGRPYAYWVDNLVRQGAALNALRGAVTELSAMHYPARSAVCDTGPVCPVCDTGEYPCPSVVVLDRWGV